MFERLGEIVESGERYTCHDGTDEPLVSSWLLSIKFPVTTQVFTWMPSNVSENETVGHESGEQKVGVL